MTSINKSFSSSSDWKNPPAQYRGAPFWSWNCTLDRETLLSQLEDFRDMGFGGVHIHCRTGMATPYLGEEFFAHVKACADRARELGLLTWLYDEDRWPSGFAGGLVTSDPAFRARHLLFTRRRYACSEAGSGVNTSTAEASRTGNGRLLWSYEIVFDDDGCLKSYRRLEPGDPAGESAWHAYLETASPGAWYNGQTYVDTLNPRAIKRFVEVTHERYRKVLGDRFGADVPAIFTDEPQFARKGVAHGDADVVLPWTDDLADTFYQTYGMRIEDRLPEVLWELPWHGASVARYRYHDHVAERFSSAFADTLGNWCRTHGIALTGHMMAEESLASQTSALGEAMRSYRAFDIPGIDMLCDKMELNTAKQAQSAARQFGRRGVMSELYGVTGWHFDFAGHKRQGDWQAALGVTVRVPHLAWVSMRGEAKRDYPAAIGRQSPWFREYPVVEDHFARLNTVLGQGTPLVRIAVVHPVESFWLCFGPPAQTQDERDEREENFEHLTRWLLFGGFDFDFLCESLLPEQCAVEMLSPMRVGSMHYDAVIVPAMRTIRGTTLDRLEAFAAAGGRVLFLGEIPSLVDAESSSRASSLAACCESVPFTKHAVLRALEPQREVRLHVAEGKWVESHAPRDVILHQLRANGENRILFCCNTDRERGRPGTRIALRGEWAFTWLETITGARESLEAHVTNGWTTAVWDAPAHGSLLVEAQPGKGSSGIRLVEPRWQEVTRLADTSPILLSEPNVLLLDQAEWRVNDGPWQAREEILRVDNLARAQLGLPRREGHLAQPWVDATTDHPQGFLELRFDVLSDVAVAAPLLACEQVECIEAWWDGESLKCVADGYFTDEAIRTVALPPMAAGAHELRLRIPMKRQSAVEWCYLLGDFGVQLAGRMAKIIAPVRELAWGDWTAQGLPFYAGNVTYQCRVEGDGEPLWIEAARFSAPLLTAELEGQARQRMAFAPFRMHLEAFEGSRSLALTAFGNRANAFGPLHNANRHLVWIGPDSWRTTGQEWTYEYHLHPMGILAAPTLQRSV